MIKVVKLGDVKLGDIVFIPVGNKIRRAKVTRRVEQLMWKDQVNNHVTVEYLPEVDGQYNFWGPRRVWFRFDRQVLIDDIQTVSTTSE